MAMFPSLQFRLPMMPINANYSSCHITVGKAPSGRWNGVLQAALIALALVIAASPVHSGEAPPLGGLVTLEGEAAPDALPLGDGKWLLVMIWATDCLICKAQKPLISAFHEAHRDVDARVVGIAMDGPAARDTVRNYLAEHPVSFDNYVVDPLRLAGDYAVLVQEPLRGTPTYLLFGPDGYIRGNNPGALKIEALERFIARPLPPRPDTASTRR